MYVSVKISVQILSTLPANWIKKLCYDRNYDFSTTIPSSLLKYILLRFFGAHSTNTNCDFWLRFDLIQNNYKCLPLELFRTVSAWTRLARKSVLNVDEIFPLWFTVCVIYYSEVRHIILDDVRVLFEFCHTFLSMLFDSN